MGPWDNGEAPRTGEDILLSVPGEYEKMTRGDYEPSSRRKCVRLRHVCGDTDLLLRMIRSFTFTMFTSCLCRPHLEKKVS